MTRSDILDKAKECVCGQREQDYGTPEDNFATIAALWSAYKDVDFTAEDVAMMMALMKIARIKTGTATEDSFVDIAGYAACGGEISSTKRNDELAEFVNAMQTVCTLEKAAKPTFGRTIDVWFDCWLDIVAAYTALEEIIKRRGSVSVWDLFSLFGTKSNIYRKPSSSLKSIGWTNTTEIRYTGDGLGHYILKLPFPVNLKRTNKEDI